MVKMNKHGFAFTAFMVVVTLVLLLSMVGLVLMKENKFNFKRIGDIQLNAIESYQNAEKTLFLIDQAGKYAAYETIHELGESGGLYSASSGCGDYLAYSLWYDAGQDCYPKNVENSFIQTYNLNVDQFLQGITTLNSFNYVLLQESPLEIAAVNKEILEFPISYETEKHIEKVENFIDIPQSNYVKGRNNREVDRIVLHYTAGSSIKGALSTFTNPSKSVSAHYIIGKDGKIVQIVKEEDTSYHAGACDQNKCVLGYKQMNSRSVGIEIVNMGWACGLIKSGKCPQGCEKAVKKCWADDPKNTLDEKYDKDRCNLRPLCWEPYPQEQWDVTVKLVADIIGRNPKITPDREHIIGHEEIKYAKFDPGPLFDMDKFVEDVKTELGTGQNGITGAAVQQAEPTFSNVRVTHYYLPSEKEVAQWHNPAYEVGKGSSYYCKIPLNKRGFYEDVMCQGSGVGEDGEGYSYLKIKPIKEDSISVPKIQTRTQTVPEPHRTIAVAPDMIPYGSKVTIKFRDCKDAECCANWEGEYIAEDRGGDMVKDWKNGIAHIDLFVGPGYKSLQETNCLPDYADLYIEGMASHSLVSETIGTYAVRPSFETKVNYDFSDYEKIERGIENLKKQCVEKGAENIEQCIKNNISNTQDGLNWSLGSCDKGKKAFFYSFVKSYQECYFSSDDDCLCKGDVYRDVSIDGDMSLDFAQEKEFVVHYLYDDEIILPGELSYMYQGNPSKPKILNWKFVFDKGNIKSSTIQNLPSFDEKSFPFYKNNSIVYFIPRTAGIGPKPFCELKQDHFQFCVTNEGRKFPRINESGDFSIDPVVYKFAIKFKDKTPPPPINNLVIKDKVKAERSLNLTWSKSEANDVDYYRIYLSENSFDNITKAKNIMNITPEGAVRTVEQLWAEELFAGTDIITQPLDNMSIVVSVEKDDKPYYLAVTAVDKSGNELQKVDAKDEKSIDDLGPKKPTFVSFSDTTKKLTMKMPSFNEDDSKINETELKLKARNLGAVSCASVIIDNSMIGIVADNAGEGETGENTEITFDRSSGCYLFTAVDGNNNINDNDLKAILNKDDFIEKVQIP